MLGGMGYTDKLQKLCALRGLDQSALASKVNLSKSSISRDLEWRPRSRSSALPTIWPKRLPRVTLDYLVDDSPELEPTDQLVMVSDDELAILKIVRRLGSDEASPAFAARPAPTSSSRRADRPLPPGKESSIGSLRDPGPSVAFSKHVPCNEGGLS